MKLEDALYEVREDYIHRGTLAEAATPQRLLYFELARLINEILERIEEGVPNET